MLKGCMDDLYAPFVFDTDSGRNSIVSRAIEPLNG